MIRFRRLTVIAVALLLVGTSLAGATRAQPSTWS